MRANRILAGGLFLAALSLGAAQAQAVERPGLETKPIGKVQVVTGTVTIEHSRNVPVLASAQAGELGQAKPNDPVYLGDVVLTRAGGTVGIVFGDGTSFNVSQNARMEINEFIYDPKSSSNSSLFNLTKGTFTFLAGKTAKTGNMRVETPVGTMGIRGTAPHVDIGDDGTVKFTTLVEEYKNRPGSRAAATGSERRAEVPPPPPGRSGRGLPRTLDICRGC